MVLRIAIVKLQGKYLVIKTTLDRKDNRVALGFRTKNDKKSK
jgi:hypothetical protein